MRLLLSVLLCTPAVAQIEAHRQPIFNGARAPQHRALEPGEQLAIGWIHGRGQPGAPFCTGTVIGPRAVLTAAHCFRGSAEPDVEFSVGEGPAALAGTVPVTQVVLHPLRDAALLRLSQPITDVVAELTPIQIGTRSPAGLVPSSVDAAGHGRTEEGEGRGLFFASVTVTCVDPGYVQVDGAGRQGICDGDSGGPYLAEGPGGAATVVAIEHEGDRSCVGVDYGLRVDVIAEWIEDQRGRFAGGLARDACDGLSYRGRCVEGRAEWCDGEVQAQTCGAGQVCGFAGVDQGFFCGAPVPCLAGSAPICEGGVLRRCQDGARVDEDCVAAGKVCVTAGETVRCLAACGAPEGATVDDGAAGRLRRPRDGVVLQGRFGMNCASADPAPAWPLWALLGALVSRRRAAREQTGPDPRVPRGAPPEIP